MSEASFSRRGRTNPLGKCTGEITVLAPEEMREAIVSLALLHNKNLSEYVRGVLTTHVYGELYAMRLAAGTVTRDEREK
mgnify:CR=1 FL=1